MDISSQDTEYDFATVSGILPDGTVVDPTSFAVEFAYLPISPGNVAGVPTSSTTWDAGTWFSGSGAGYTAQIVVGPAGTVTLAVGGYARFVRIHATPGPVVVACGTLDVY